MVQIDKNDKLYKYLTNLGVEDVEQTYLTLANEGRYNLDDVRQYFRQDYLPSQTKELDEKELEKILDYYVDLKSVKTFNASQLKKLLENYSETKDDKVKELILNSQLKDVLYLCLNYFTLHDNTDLQDLVQIANLGLIEAIDKYNPTAKIDFKDYVIYYVRKNIKEFEEKTNG